MAYRPAAIKLDAEGAFDEASALTESEVPTGTILAM